MMSTLGIPSCPGGNGRIHVSSYEITTPVSYVTLTSSSTATSLCRAEAGYLESPVASVANVHLVQVHYSAGWWPQRQSPARISE